MPVSVLEGAERVELTEFEYVPVVWWKPWTWNRVAASRTTRGAEWTQDDVLMLLAAQQKADDRGSHGIEMGVATDADNQFRFKVAGPTVDWAAQALSSRQDAYYKQYDRPGEPVSRAGHLWQVRLGDEADDGQGGGESTTGPA